MEQVHLCRLDRLLVAFTKLSQLATFKFTTEINLTTNCAILFPQSLDIKLKWPNDIYANSEVKIGGLIVNSIIEGDMAICNVGKDARIFQEYS